MFCFQQRCGSRWICIKKILPDPDGQMRIRIQEVKSLENVQVQEVNTEQEDQK